MRHVLTALPSAILAQLLRDKSSLHGGGAVGGGSGGGDGGGGDGDGGGGDGDGGGGDGDGGGGDGDGGEGEGGGGIGGALATLSWHSASLASPQSTFSLHQVDSQQLRPAGQSAVVAHVVHVATLGGAYSEYCVEHQFCIGGGMGGGGEGEGGSGEGDGCEGAGGGGDEGGDQPQVCAT